MPFPQSKDFPRGTQGQNLQAVFLCSLLLQRRIWSSFSPKVTLSGAWEAGVPRC